MNKLNKRPLWDEYFISMLDIIASRSTCLRRKVSAIIVRDNHILTTGYNGQPSRMNHCSDIGECLREKLNIPSGQRYELCKAVHAEENAILQASKFGVNIEGATMYLSYSPCSYCTKSILTVGIVRVVYIEKYPDKLAEELRQEAKWVEFEQYKSPRDPSENIPLYPDEKLRCSVRYPSYWISNYGRIFKNVVLDLNDKVVDTGIWIEPIYDLNEGDSEVYLMKDGEKIKENIARLVINVWFNKTCTSNLIRYKDRNRRNRHVDNLGWVI